MDKKRLNTEYGYIDYFYTINDHYPNGLLLFMGSYVEKEFRGQGKFKELVKRLFLSFPENTVIQAAVANKHLISMFERMGFQRVKSVEYWGEASNSVKFQGSLYEGITNKI